jgi:hypothetical protein
METIKAGYWNVNNGRKMPKSKKKWFLASFGGESTTTSAARA